jgi:hypothetical protein
MKTKRQHFIPRFYLRQFTNAKGKLQVYRRGADSYFSAAPEGVCAENYLYEVKHLGFAESGNPEPLHNYIENKLASEESYLAPLYDRLIGCCDRHDFATEEFNEGRLATCKIAANLMVRHPCLLEDDRLGARDLTKTFLADNELSEDEWRTLVSNFVGSDDIDVLSEAAIMQTLLLSEYPEVPSNRIYRAFANKKMMIIQAPVGISFITTSMPLVFVGIDEDAYDFRVAYMPLSSKYAAFFTVYERSASFVEASTEDVVRCNAAILTDNGFWDTAIAQTKESLKTAVREWRETIGVKQTDDGAPS